MVYQVYSKIQIKGELLVVRSLHVGGFGTSTNVDLPLAVNGQNQVCIPGTSLAGALRGWMYRVNPDVVDRLWGFQPDAKSPNSDRGHASRILIEDAPVQLKNSSGETPFMTPQQMEIRSGVGINRHSGAAADQCLYNRGVIPRGATLEFNLSVEIVDHQQEDTIKQAVDQLLLAMQLEEIRLGAAKSRGLGRVQLTKCQQLAPAETPTVAGVTPFRFNERQAMLAFLKHRSNPDSGFKAWTAPKQVHTLPQLTMKLYWQPVGPLMVKSELTGVAVDIMPLMGRVGQDETAFLLPGASIKGALRSHAERIIRTVLQQPLIHKNDIKQQIRLPLINTLFGLSADQKIESSSKWLPGLGALYIEDCFSQTRHTADALQQVSRVSQDNPEGLKKALADTKLTADQHETQLAYHVAVDRWTGGAAENFLYTNLEPFNLPWEPIEVTVNFDRFPKEDEDAEQEPLSGVALLLLLLRDMADRRIPLGYGTNRGLGTLTLTKVEFTPKGDVPGRLKALKKDSWKAKNQSLAFASLDKGLVSELNQVWSAWTDRHSQDTAKSEQESTDGE